MARDLNINEIKKLWLLDLVVQAGSLRKAAIRAGVSPSAVSQMLTSLEGTLGKPLLIKDKGRVSPTNHAVTILAIMKPAFEAFDKLQNVQHHKPPAMVSFSFGTYESIAVDILPGLIQSLRATMPKLKLKLCISRTANLLTMIRKGELSSAVVIEAEGLERFYAKEIFVDRLGFFVASGRPIARLGWNAAKEFGVGSLSPSKDGLPRYYMRFLKQLGGLKPSVFSESFEALRAAAAAGVLVSILPCRVANRSEGLLEIFREGALSKDRGTHRILVIGRENCDKEEIDFLAVETSRLLAKI